MASKPAIAAALATMQELFPTRDITEHTARVFHEMLKDLPNDTLLEAVRKCCNEPGRTFFPTVGEIRAALPRPAVRSPEPEAVGRAIEKLGRYDPHVGWVYPRPTEVRQRLGDGIANAYGLVGAQRLFSANDTTREIALREFSEALKSEQGAGHAIALPPPAPMLQLPAGDAA